MSAANQEEGNSSESVTPTRESHHSSYSPQHSPPTHSDSEDEGLLETSATVDEVTQLLRNTVEELELALEVKYSQCVEWTALSVSDMLVCRTLASCLLRERMS